MDRASIAQYEVLVAFLKVFLIEVASYKKLSIKDIVTKFLNDKSDVLHNLVDSIEKNYSELHAPKDYADVLCGSTKTLAGIVKKYLQQTPSSLISNRIIIEAKRELYLTSKPLKQIAANLGYNEEYNFSRFFKRKEGVFPVIYKRKLDFVKLEK